jgi:membrane protein DedA with SNARE-associated domain
MIKLLAIFGISSKLGYLLPAVVGLESMGVPSPGETALILAAVLANQGKLQIWLVILIAIASAIIGDNIAYFLGRAIGREVLEKPGPFYKRRKQLLTVGERFFEKHGAKAVFLGRWVALLRVAAAWIAGINEMPFPRFFLWNALGGITWATTVGLAGYFGGHAAEKVIKNVGIYGAIALGVLLVAGFVWLRVRERRALQRELEGGPERDAEGGD